MKDAKPVGTNGETLDSRFARPVDRFINQSILFLVTVLLGAALGIGVLTASGIERWTEDRLLRAVLVWFYSAGTFVYYFHFLTLYRLRTHIAWLGLPFVFGTAAAVAAGAIASGRWFTEASFVFFLGSGLVFVMALAEQANGWFALPVASAERNRMAADLLRTEMRKNAACFGGLVLAHALAIGARPWFAASGWSETFVLFVIAATIFPAMMMLTETRFLPKVRALM